MKQKRRENAAVEQTRREEAAVKQKRLEEAAVTQKRREEAAVKEKHRKEAAAEQMRRDNAAAEQTRQEEAATEQMSQEEAVAAAAEQKCQQEAAAVAEQMQLVVMNDETGHKKRSLDQHSLVIYEGQPPTALAAQADMAPQEQCDVPTPQRKKSKNFKMEEKQVEVSKGHVSSLMQAVLFENQNKEQSEANDEFGLLMEGEVNVWEQDDPLDDLSIDGIDRYS